MALLHDLGVSFIKVDSAYIRNLDQNSGNQVFLKGLSDIAHQIGLIVIAEGVATIEEIEALKLAGFDGATGPIVNMDKDKLDLNLKNYYITNKT
jgi:EAL domain-containing protein (putative c-di-GMP-specific phosphodiesterase class I)